MTHEDAFYGVLAGKTTPTELWTTIRTRMVWTARAVLAKWRRVHLPVEVDDLVQDGFLEVLRRLGVVEGGKPWDPDAPNAWPLADYVHYGAGWAMRRRVRNTLKMYRKGQSPAVFAPNLAVTLSTVVADGDEPRAFEYQRTPWSGLSQDDAVACRQWADALPESDSVIMTYALRSVLHGGRLEDGCREYMYDNFDRRQGVWRRVDKLIGTRMSNKFALVSSDEVVGLKNDSIEQLIVRVKDEWAKCLQGSLPLARLLYHVRKDELWKKGDIFHSYNDFLRSGAEMGSEIPSSTGSALPNAYGVALEVAEELGLSVDEVWQRIQWTKLLILTQAPGALRGTLIEKAMDGASRRELEGLVKNADFDESVLVAADEAPALTDVPLPEPDERVTGKVSSTEVLEADIRVSPVDLVTLQPAVGAPVGEIDRVMFRYPMRNGGTAIEFRVEVKDGKVRGAVLRFVPKGTA